MTFEQLYRKAKKYLKKQDMRCFAQGVYSYEFEVTGEGGGKFYAEVKDGALDIQPCDYKNSLCSFKVSSDDLMRILDRSLSPTAAYSTGRLTVHGDVSAAFRLCDSLGILL